MPDVIKKNPNNSLTVTTVRRWRVMEVAMKGGTRTRHLWGHDVTNNSGLASSAIKEFNLDTMTITTRSGTNYKLVGLPGNSRLGLSAWNNWCSSNKIVSGKDVTKEYFDVDQFSATTFEKINNSLNQ